MYAIASSVVCDGFQSMLHCCTVQEENERLKKQLTGDIDMSANSQMTPEGRCCHLFSKLSSFSLFFVSS